jgi:7-cyano-7-deazaguanine synthase
MKAKSIVLLSGGLDSTVSCAIAQRRTRALFALTFDYGQRAAKMEVRASRKICRALDISHRIVRLPFFTDFKNLAMLSSTEKVGAEKFLRLQDVWVPNRNALFINIGAVYAEYYGARLIITGFNLEEALEFPDNSVRFVQSINNTLRYSTLTKVEVRSYVANLTKKEIYQLGIKYGAPLQHVYSCYLGGKRMCGKCASCRRLLQATEGP